MRRRKRAKYTWMPTLGGVSTSGDTSRGTAAFGQIIDVDSDTAVRNGFVTSLVPDETFQPDAAQTEQVSLRDFTEGQDWFLKRIVGKVWVGVAQSIPSVQDQVSWRNCWVTAAFFVAKAKDTNPEVPDLDFDEYDPQESQNVRQPWIWRRSWLLTDFGVTPNTHRQYSYPSSNTLNTGSGQMDGPHVDAKTARRIRREERLWFVAAAYGFSGAVLDFGGVVSDSQLQIAVNVDYRILGQMRRSTNRSTFG